MADRDTYEKENTAADTWGIRLYIGILLFVGGLLTVYQSTTGTEAPFLGWRGRDGGQRCLRWATPPSSDMSAFCGENTPRPDPE
ncbi:MAG: hypothetical protein A07HN63_02300 [uncultured archaeon A07HN63]|nr:MAG: hypothetical protein A07HN63_02300 [uncultured archaeon A07HN63]